MTEEFLRAVWYGMIEHGDVLRRISTVGTNPIQSGRELVVTMYKPWRVIKLRVQGDIVELVSQKLPNSCGVTLDAWHLGDPEMPNLTALLVAEIMR